MDANLYFTVDFNFWSNSDVVDRHSQLEIQHRGSSEHKPIALDSGDMFREQLEEFGDCIRSRKKPEVGGPEGIAALAVIDAALRSAATGHTVAIKEVMEA
jgi:predicted dehydrogenase